MLFLMALSDRPDDAAFMEELYRTHYRLLYGKALQIMRHAADAEDVVSESFLQLIRRIDTLRSLESNKLRAYLVITVKHTAINLYHRRSRRLQHSGGELQEHMQDSGVAGPEQQALSCDGVEGIKQAIRCLPHQVQTAMMMRYFQQLSDQEIADSMGLKPVSVRALLSKGRKRLQEMLREGGEADV